MIEGKNIMTKFGPKAQEKIKKVMHEMKKGELKSSSAQKVTSQHPAVAIGLSQARQASGKVLKKN